MRYIFLFIFIFTFSISLKAQYSSLYLINKDKDKVVHLRKGGLVVLEYQGYLNQTELHSNYIIGINDNSLLLGKPGLFNKPDKVKEIRLDDITGFRKKSAGSELLKTALTVGATLGTYYAIRENEDKLNSTQQLVYSLGAGLVTSISLKFIFPDNKIKYKLKDGWKIQLR